MAFRILINSIKTSLEFVYDRIFWFFFSILMVFVLSFLWGRKEYFLIVLPMDTLLISGVLRAIDGDVRSGRILNVLLKPIDEDVWYFLISIGRRIVFLPFLFILALLFNLDLFGILRIILLYPSIQLLRFYILFFFAAFSPRTEASGAIYSLVYGVFDIFLSGKIIPIEYLGKIGLYNPFSFFGGRIYCIYKGKMLLENLILLAFYTVLFYLLSKILWRRLIKEYESYGV